MAWARGRVESEGESRLGWVMEGDEETGVAAGCAWAAAGGSEVA